jgi:hypothetical protein
LIGDPWSDQSEAIMSNDDIGGSIGKEAIAKLIRSAQLAAENKARELAPDCGRDVAVSWALKHMAEYLKKELAKFRIVAAHNPDH